MKNKTKMTVAVQMALTKITTKKTRVISLIIGIVAILLGIFLYGKSKSFGVGLVILGIAIIIVFVLLLNRLMYKQIIKTNQFNGELDNYYEFSNEGFTITTIRRKEQVGESLLKYTDIIKILENSSFIFIYISNNNAFALLKNSMTEGRVEDLISLLKTKVEKYKII